MKVLRQCFSPYWLFVIFWRAELSGGSSSAALQGVPSPGSGDSSLLNSITSSSEDFSHLYFGTSNGSTVTSQTGSTAHLPCNIHNLGEGVVSWIRRKDRHLITVGQVTYNADQRYQLVHAENSEDWSLQIRYVQKRDGGLYECQVASHPPVSVLIQLNVVEAKAQISGPAEKYLKPGSTLRLQCVVLKATETPAYIFWFHNSRMINFDIDLGVNVSTDLVGRSSSLLIPTTAYSHAGNYSCVPNNAHPAFIYVHIFNGENPAAMQSRAHSERINEKPLPGFSIYLMFLYLPVFVLS